ncbi:MAG: hypothetical protein K5746_01400 [Clostridiales bacterium]|nr:hypothetical protein [Clostridiales bacterium]
MGKKRVVLSELWEKLQKEPYGFYDTIACGVVLGYLFSPYKDSAFSWTDSAQSTHVLGESTLKTMVLNMVKGKMTTDYLSSGSQTFQKYRDYVKAIMNLTDVQVASENECWHNMRTAVTNSGVPFWTLKYLDAGLYSSGDFHKAGIAIIDLMQRFIAEETEHESIMSNVVQLFGGRGKVKSTLRQAFSDKHALSEAFRTYLFGVSPQLKAIADKLKIQPEELSDKLHGVMQDAIYTWTEEQVKEKLTLNGIELGEGLLKEEADAIHEKYGINFSKETV